VPHGHHDDPLTDAEVEQKFAALAGRRLTPDRLALALNVIRDFEHCARIDELFDAFAIEVEAS
jgi:hypothetical protein